MPNTYVYNNGSWNFAKGIFIGNSGSWARVKNAWTWKDGSWVQTYQYAFVFNPVLDGGNGYIVNYNIRSAAATAGWDQVRPLLATITLQNGMVIGSASTGAYGFDTDLNYPASSQLVLINNSGCYISGAGGPGSGGNQPAGPAMIAQAPITVYNYGTIQGGGNGGSPGSHNKGGGGAGYYAGTGSNGGADGTLTSGGAGGYDSAKGTTNGGAGDGPGDAHSIDGVGNVTFGAVGTLLGATS